MSVNASSRLASADRLNLVVRVRDIAQDRADRVSVGCPWQVLREVIRRRKWRVLWLDNFIENTMHACAVDIRAAAASVAESENKIAIVLLLNDAGR